MDASAENPLHLPQEAAVARHAAAVNTAVVWRVAAVAAAVAAGAALMFFALEQTAPMALALGDVVIIALLYARSGSRAIAEHPRAFCLAFLLSQFILALAPLWGLEPAVRVGLSGVALPLLVLTLQLRPGDYLVLFAPLWGITVWVWLRELEGLWGAPRGLGGLLWPTLVTAGFYSAALALANRRRQRFLAGWRREVSMDRERERMREEIEDARQIQLSMLPRGVPRVGWVDVSAVSMPASEVGGDYYDYFELPLSSLALVVGDVAGHGLASGLMLSALRSCLYLLREELVAPAAVMERLNDMVRHTAARRMLVTLLCGFLDGEDRSLTVSSAGHPPALLYSAATTQIEELTLPALPLGTRLAAGFTATRVSLAAGDTAVFYTDGLTEMTDGSGEGYGPHRLSRVVCESAAKPAREIRNAVLADLANFKGDSRRLDDVTLVVVKVR